MGWGPCANIPSGAVLLDKEDPRKVLARTAHPIVSPSDEDREGYVPNVVYTCGALAHGRRLFMPFGVADSSVAFGFIDLDETAVGHEPRAVAATFHSTASGAVGKPTEGAL
ncbi:MAG: hypothetical protein WDN45_16680 [Caulobacteraceae bacterium]